MMEIFNSLELTQRFLKENEKKVKCIDLDFHRITIIFDSGGSVSISFDVADIVLSANLTLYERMKIQDMGE